MCINDGFCVVCVDGNARLFVSACGERRNDCLLIHRALEVLGEKVYPILQRERYAKRVETCR